MKEHAKTFLTVGIVLLAILLVLLKYWDYVVNPWTRNGQVRADVIQLTSRVTGPIINLPIEDNQFVQRGELLFEIDPRTFQAAVDKARADLENIGDNVVALEKQVEAATASVDVSRANIEQAESAISAYDATIARNLADLNRQRDLLPKKATSERSLERAIANYEVSVQQKRSAEASLLQARASLAEAEAALAEAEAKLGAIGEANPQVKAAIAAVRQAELDLEFTQVTAPVDGYVTNLNLRIGSQAVANQPSLALVDVASYRIDGFFKETDVGRIQPGDQAVVTLMSYPDQPLQGFVTSLGWGIAQQDGSTGADMLPQVSPTFEWIRLAQRVPVQIRLTDVPEDIDLRVGTTASVLVRTGTAADPSDRRATAVPRVLQ